ncbi:L,D-transpeptidase family protein [Pararhodobacter sp.]|uniref:L,D-transpeptidase family protein n=1 Tax=Pararhodobacter sp. TaxID=2127056 RepID=UPI002AFFDBAB|nr:L,D-transpeptidase family protein [Pararhodobacter sp.]
MGIRFRGRVFPCTIGRGGVTADKREGDGATPVGRHRITDILFRPDRIAAHLLPPTARPIGPRDLWCDDPGHPAYNHQTRAPFAASHEILRRADPLYDLILTTDWNWPDAQPGKGSAIFLHTWRRPGFPTAGCVAFARRDLLWITQNLAPTSRLIVPASVASRAKNR